MSLACVYSRARVGLTAPLVTVEVHLANGLPAFNIVGLPETSVRESKDRVRSAIINCGYEFPAKRITINLAPADLPKEGGRFDLPIAVSIMGPIHGFAFIAYIAALVAALGTGLITIVKLVVGTVAAFIPFGSFVFERFMLKDQSAST